MYGNATDYESAFAGVKKTTDATQEEYDRLYAMFYLQKFQINPGQTVTLRNCCAISFASFPFRGTCVSLDDFDDTCGYRFEKDPAEFDIDYLVGFCEYTYNLLIYCQGFPYNNPVLMTMAPPIRFFLQQIMSVVELIGYTTNNQNGITDFVPKDQAAISVSEIVDSSLSYRVIEYNHHSMKGNLERKKATLIALADKLEAKRAKLKQINTSLESDLFYLLNSVNVRHNNADQGSKNYIHFVADMKDEDIEQWYDDIYQMCLLAFLELDHLERKERVRQLKAKIQKNE